MAAGANVFAQGVRIGVKAGGNLSSVNYSEKVEGLKSKPGFQLGVTADYQLAGNLLLLSGLEIVQKGWKLEVNSEYSRVKTTASPLYLQLPVHIGYKIDLGAVQLVPQAGPYIAYGLGGKASYDDEDQSDKSDYFGKENNVKRLDFGIGAGIGVEFGKIGVNLGYDLGLANIIDKKEGTESIKNASLFLNLGYKF